MALILRRRGVNRVRPLAGGFYAWRDLGYPVVALERAAPAALPETPAGAPRR